VSTVLESGDHALQIKYWYLFTKLTSTSRSYSSLSEQFKKVSCAKTDFFVRVHTKYRTFSRTTHNKNIHQLIDRPPKPCPTMATRAIQHHRWCLLSPPLLSRPSISPRSQTNSPRGSTQMGRFHVWAALWHKMCLGGTNKTIGPVPFRIDLMGDREGRYWRGDVTINCGWRRRRVGDTTIILRARGQF
jgi:hypothetical protein